MAEVVLERRAALRSNGEKIREVVRLKELQHHFISYRSKVFWTRKKSHFVWCVLGREITLTFWVAFWTRGITFTFWVVFWRNHFYVLCGVCWEENSLSLSGGCLSKRNHFRFLRGVFWEENSLPLSGWCFWGIEITFTCWVVF